jgi:hypothetical protein
LVPPEKHPACSGSGNQHRWGGWTLTPIIQIYDVDRVETTLIRLDLEAAQKLVEDLIGTVEMVERMMAGPDDVTH